MLNAVDDNYGGLEHRNSTALICGRRDLPRSASAWAKAASNRGLHHAAGPDQPRVLPHLERQAPAPGRVRPLRLHAENYTELLWFFEGFTSYYDDLLLRRAGLIDNASTWPC
jgi:predicted metalloprotease with PDZ domain